MSEFSTQEATGVEVDPDGSAAPTLRATSPLGDAIVEYEGQMVRKGFSENTIKAFANDLKILRTFMDGSAVLREIQTRHLEDFLEWMQSERGRPCSAKTLSRRITTLKVFFAWLHSVGAIGTDPAEPLIQQSVRTPLPVILNNNEAGKLMRACQDWLWDRVKSDARPYVLVSLLLQTGIKKSEAVKILLDDIERPESEEPSVFIRYKEERYAHKNRRISLNTSFLGPLDQYLEQYKPENFLFECTPRNLEYVLEEAGIRAGIRRIQVGFETLRWTSAVRDFRQGMKDESLRLKMGLSKVSWRETSFKIQRLAGQP
ncbi:MAG: site-specific integrase [Caldilineaceae bacterium]|nr:site-specific integrase [Caldilineaceae bacterium]MDE0463202.1 site-specific integrase [Caldilineaceae bacterium]